MALQSMFGRVPIKSLLYIYSRSAGCPSCLVLRFFIRANAEYYSDRLKTGRLGAGLGPLEGGGCSTKRG